MIFIFLQRWMVALRRYCLWSIVCLAACAGPAKAAADEAQARFRLGGLDGVQASISVLSDPDESLDWQQVQATGLFQPLMPGRNQIFNSNDTWYRIDLSVPVELRGETAWLRVVPALIWQLEWHDELGQSGLAGMSVPMSAQDRPTSPNVIKVRLDRSHIRLYLRVLSAAPQLTHLSLLSEQALQEEVQLNTYVRALFLGSVGLMLTLTLLNWFYTRSSLYRDFAVYLVATVLFVLCVDGDINTYILKSRPEWMARLSSSSFMWAIAATIIFSLRTMRIPERLPQLATRLRFLAGIVLLATVLGWNLEWIAPLSSVMWPFHMVLGLALLAISLQQAWRWRTAQSWVVFSAYLCFNVFEKYPMMTMLGWFPVEAWTSDVAKAGLVCQMLLTQIQSAMQLREQQALEHRALQADLEAQSERSQRGDLLQFLGMFGHEVRTPLAIIHAATESLEMLPGSEHPANRARHERIRSAVERLSVLSREALSRERIEAGGWKPRLRSVEPQSLVEDLLWLQEVDLPSDFSGSLSEPQVLPWKIAGRPGGRLSVNLAANLPVLQADPDMLHMAMGNLLDNARKYAAPASEVRLLVWSTPQLSDELQICFIEVSSQGIELTEQERARMFDKYWRRDENRNVPGAGIGLHLVRTIVKAHAGQIDVQSLPDRWTQFRISLPCQIRPAAACGVQT